MRKRIFGNISVLFHRIPEFQKSRVGRENNSHCSQPRICALPHPTENPGSDRIPLYSHTHGALIPGSVLWDEEEGKWDGNRMGETMREFHL